MDKATKTVESWFLKQPKWQQETMRLIVEEKHFEDLDIYNLFRQEVVEGKDINIGPFQHGWLYYDENPVSIRLIKLFNPVGINNLDSTMTLPFGEKPLCLVYGENGSGKSGYTRILKKLNDRSSSELLPNVFNPRSTQSCSFSVCANGQYLTYENLDLLDSGSAVGINTLHIFDTSVSNSYIKDKHTYSFEPPLLRHISKLGMMFVKLSELLEKELVKIKITKLIVPSEIAETKYAKEYNTLNFATNMDIFTSAIWDVSAAHRLETLQVLLNSKDISATFTVTKMKADALKNLLNVAISLSEKCSIERQEEVINNHTAVIEQRRTVIEANQVLNDNCCTPINDITWKNMWLASKEYIRATEIGKHSLFVGENARCPLCQQVLDEEAQSRFTQFNEYIEGTINRTLEELEQCAKKLLDKLQLQITAEEISQWKESCHLCDELVQMFQEAYDKYHFIYQAAINDDGLQKIILFNDATLCARLQELSNQADVELEVAKALLEETEKKRAEFEQEVKLLTATKWVVENICGIKDEYEKCCIIKKLTDAKGQLSTKALTQKQKELSQELITDAYISRFNAELQTLGVKKVHVKCKTTGSVGKVLNSLVLFDGSTEFSKPWEVLSEGEARVVALASFFADVQGASESTPLIFDDPISSLDDKFEQAIASRLVAFSKERQVIVFTHRLAFYNDLQTKANEAEIECHATELYSVAQAAGRVKEPSIFTGIPLSRLKVISLEKLQQARKEYAQNGRSDEYITNMVTICNAIRVTVEDMVATSLLGDIVRRNRPDIQTKKLKYLADITEDDCSKIERWMTKYSYTVHSRSDDISPETYEDDSIFSIATIQKDIDEMIQFLSNIKNRRK